MQKDIIFSGFSANPSDHEAIDGSLACSLNLICEDGALRPVASKNILANVPKDATVLYLHKTSSGSNWILSRPKHEGVELGWAPFDNDNSPQDLDKDTIWLNRVFISPLDIKAMGNTLILSDNSDGINYILWADNNYNILGNRPPLLDIQFGCSLVQDYITLGVQEVSLPALVDVGLGNSGNYSIKGNSAVSTEVSDEAWSKGSNLIYGVLNKTIKERVTERGRFCQPFFLRYAYRLYDGSYIWHSAPILIQPWVIPPLISKTHSSQAPGNNSEVNPLDGISCYLNVIAPPAILDYRIDLPESNKSSFKKWKDLILGLDIFVSPPIYSYDTNENLSSDNHFSKLSSLSIYPEDTSDENAFVAHLGRYVTFNLIDKRRTYYCDLSIDMALKRFLNINGSYSFIVPNLKETYKDDFLNVANFYKIATIEFDDIVHSDQMIPLPLDHEDLSNLLTRQVLPDDYDSRATKAASDLFVFNSKLYASNISYRPTTPFSFISCAENQYPGFYAPYPESTAGYAIQDSVEKNVYLSVFLKKNEQSASARNSSSKFPLDSSFPRFIYYPDASASLLNVASGLNSQDTVHSLPLKPHAFLNGSYWFNDSFLMDSLPKGEIKEPPSSSSRVLLENKIYVSQVNNPLIFPVQSILTVGSGQIKSLSAAAQALSQGQFGQFPIYVFSSDGIWAVEIGADGSSRSVQPITRDVVLSKNSICQLDNSIMFITKRGIMHLQGSTAIPISDAILADKIFNINSLPVLCLDSIPLPGSLIEHLDLCRIMFDYNGQRILIFIPDSIKKENDKVAGMPTLIYSLKSKQWGMASYDLEYPVNSYPEMIAVDAQYEIIDFLSRKTCDSQLAVTRPFKLDNPYILKTIRTIIQRGYFRRGHLKTILYGSNNLFDWHLIKTSSSHEIRNISGSPYKYFRVAIIGNLQSGESIHSASLEWIQRFNNRLR